MNCKQVENLLPLYVGRDLEGRSERLVTDHVESCAACSAAAAEYRQTRELLQGFAPPAFSEDVYAGIRQNVWRRIEAGSTTVSMSEVIAGWFRPRVIWAAASAVLVAVLVLGFVLIGNRSTREQKVAVNASETDRDGSNKQIAAEAPREKPIPSPLAPRERVKGPRQAYLRHSERKGDRKRAPDRLNTLVANAPDALPNTSGSPRLGTSSDPDPSPASDSVKTLRMEIQTKDPNIRIIWFAQRDTKPVSHNSKGT
jgi:Putative zinc-finger